MYLLLERQLELEMLSREGKGQLIIFWALLMTLWRACLSATVMTYRIPCSHGVCKGTSNSWLKEGHQQCLVGLVCPEEVKLPGHPGDAWNLWKQNYKRDTGKASYHDKKRNTSRKQKVNSSKPRGVSCILYVCTESLVDEDMKQQDSPGEDEQVIQLAVIMSMQT